MLRQAVILLKEVKDEDKGNWEEEYTRAVNAQEDETAAAFDIMKALQDIC